MFQHVGIQLIFFYVKLCNTKMHHVVFFSSTCSIYHNFLSQYEICDKILEILKFFNNAIHIFSGVYYPTTHLFIFESLNIIGTLDEHVESPDPNDIVLFEAINVMKRKWLHCLRD